MTGFLFLLTAIFVAAFLPRRMLAEPVSDAPEVKEAEMGETSDG